MSNLKTILESHIISKNNCWITNLLENYNGYPQIRINHKIKNASRLSYEIFKGTIPKHSVIRHSCNNRNCINPEHLFLKQGVNNDNDYIKETGKNREGSKNYNSRLNEIQVIEIKKLLAQKQLAQTEIARQFGISTQQITNIKSGRCWANISI
ncbi:MAG TPA: HNH endonuclease [Allocoleopsis sp.]